MSLKSIDMQLSVSRSMELSQVQNQLAQKPMDDQAAAAMQAMRQQLLERTRSGRTEKPSEGKIHRDDGNPRGHSEPSGGNAESGGGHAEERAKPREAKHPYKGKYIDLTL